MYLHASRDSAIIVFVRGHPLPVPVADEVSFDAALAQASFRAVMERLPDAVVVVHRDNTILYANPAAGIIFGFAKSAHLLGRSLALLIHQEDSDALRGHLAALVATGQPSPRHELRALRRNGTVADVEVSATRVVFGAKPAVLALLRDVSETAPADPTTG